MGPVAHSRPLPLRPAGAVEIAPAVHLLETEEAGAVLLDGMASWWVRADVVGRRLAAVQRSDPVIAAESLDEQLPAFRGATAMWSGRRAHHFVPRWTVDARVRGRSSPHIPLVDRAPPWCGRERVQEVLLNQSAGVVAEFPVRQGTPRRVARRPVGGARGGARGARPFPPR